MTDPGLSKRASKTTSLKGKRSGQRYAGNDETEINNGTIYDGKNVSRKTSKDLGKKTSNDLGKKSSKDLEETGSIARNQQTEETKEKNANANSAYVSTRRGKSKNPSNTSGRLSSSGRTTATAATAPVTAAAARPFASRVSKAASVAPKTKEEATQINSSLFLDCQDCQCCR